MSKIKVTLTGEFTIHLRNYVNVVDAEGVTRSLTDPKEILEFEKAQLIDGDIDIQDLLDLNADTSKIELELVEDQSE